MSESTAKADENFARFLDEDRSRNYGFGPSYPQYVQSTINYIKTSTLKALREQRKEAAQMILQIVQATREKEAKTHAELPPHLKDLYRGKRFCLMELLLEKAADNGPALAKRKCQIMSIVPKLLAGFAETGELLPSGFWETIKPEARRKIEKECEEADLSRAREFPTRDHWAKEEELEECWRQMSKMVEAGLWYIGELSEVGPNGASIAFPVIQGDPPKTRVCIDKRLSNTQILTSEKMRLFHSRTACEIMLACLSKTGVTPSFLQSRQDIHADVEVERDLRSKIHADLDLMHRSRDLSSLPEEPDADEETTFAFLPVSQKRDLIRFYYQSGARDPRLNAIFFAQPHSVDESAAGEGDACQGPDTKRRKRQRKWIVVFSKVAVFGSRSSVYECVHVSEALMAILNGPLKILCTLYIDDVHGIGRKELANEDAALIDLFFSESGWRSSDEKKEIQDWQRQKSLVVLGMAYTIIGELEASVQVNPAKVVELLRKGKILIQSIDDKNVKEKSILNYKGLFRHVAQLDRLMVAKAKGLDYWQGDNFTSSIKKANDRKQLRTSVCEMQDAALRVVPFRLSSAKSMLQVAHLYTDAAGENLAELNRLIAAGQRNGFEEFDMWIGGFLALPDGRKLAFKMPITSIPQEVTKVTIGLLEAAAARIAIDFFKNELKGFLVVAHIDNLGDVFSLTRNSSRENNTQRMSSQFHRVAAEYGLEIFVTWICTKRNVADPLTRAARSAVLEQLFPDMVPTAIQTDIVHLFRFWGIQQQEGAPSSVF